MGTMKKYTKKPYKKYSTKKRSYKPRYSRRPALRQGYRKRVTAHKKPMAQIQFCQIETSFQALIPPGLAPGNDINTIQGQVLATWTAAAQAAANNRINYLMLCHSYYRISRAHVKVEMGGQVTQSSTGAQSIGKILIVPIHSIGDITGSGAGGGSILQTNSTFWQTQPHVKTMTADGGALRPATLNISPSVLRLVVRNATFGTTGLTSHCTTEFTKNNWYATRDYDGSGTGDMCADLHYGYTIFWSGFTTPVTFQILKISTTYDYEFKDWDPTVTLQQVDVKSHKFYLNHEEAKKDTEHKGIKHQHIYRQRDFDREGKMIREFPIGQGIPNQGHLDEEKYLHVEQEEEEEEDMDPRPRGKRKESPTHSVHDITRRMSRTLTNSRPI